MRKLGICISAVCAIFLCVCAGGLVYEARTSSNSGYNIRKWPEGLQWDAARCVIVYQMKNADADADREQHKINSRFLSEFVGGEAAGYIAPGFPDRCSGFVNDSKSFKKLDEYVLSPPDGDIPSDLQEMCAVKKNRYAESFNQHLGRDWPALYQSACDAVEQINRPQS